MNVDTILHGDALEVLRTLPSESVHCIVTSPPYFGLRDYGAAGQIGLEAMPQEYVAHLVAVFAEARRVLRDDGTLWLNLGDSYYAHNGTRGNVSDAAPDNKNVKAITHIHRAAPSADLKPKDLVGIPWRVAFALQADGWWLRSDIIWHKPNCMPESVRDRPTRAHEYLFLLAKSERYYYDSEAIREQPAPSSLARIQQPNFANQTGGPKDYANGVNPNQSIRRALENWAGRVDKQRGHSRRHAGFNDHWDLMTKAEQAVNGRNKRDVWTIATRPFAGAHFAVMPLPLVEPCILAGSPSGGVVLDPFMGAGTVAVAARRHSRHYLGIELNAAYIALAEERIAAEVQPVLWSIAQ